MKDQKRMIIVLTTFLFSAVLFLPVKAMASGYDTGITKGSGSMTDDGHAHMDEMGEYALNSYCPVAIHKGMFLKGNHHYVTEYKGKVYKFVKFEAQKAFLENPEVFLQNVEQKYQDLKEQSMGSHTKKGS